LSRFVIEKEQRAIRQAARRIDYRAIGLKRKSDHAACKVGF
jgi:hypothetical protein